MKRLIKVFSLVIAILLITVYILPVTVSAEKGLDEIEKYTVVINVREDGTLDMRYEIVWHVLDDKGKTEPLTWVKIGIPNEHVDQYQALSDNISKIKYFSENGGDFVRIDFTEKYYKDQVVRFSFSIHQGYMYILDEDNICRYGFTPGWFEDIPIEELHILWNNANVLSSDAHHKGEEYLEWYKTDMSEGERLGVNVRYDVHQFGVDSTRQYTEKRASNNNKIVLIVIIVIIAIIIVLLIIRKKVNDNDSYGGGRGFGGGGSTFIHTSSSSCAHSSCACACVSCACACACAGGGRAGCSAKFGIHIQGIYEACHPDPWYKHIFKRK